MPQKKAMHMERRTTRFQVDSRLLRPGDRRRYGTERMTQDQVINGIGMFLGYSCMAFVVPWRICTPRMVLRDLKRGIQMVVVCAAVAAMVCVGPLAAAPSGADWDDYLYPEEYLDAESRSPEGFLKLFISSDGQDAPGNGDSVERPIGSLYYAKLLIDEIEAHDRRHGVSRYAGYSLLLKRGDTFVPHRAFELQPSRSECSSQEYNRAAFYWNINKPLLVTSYGTSGGRPVVSGETGYITKTNSYGEENRTVRVQMAFVICPSPEIGKAKVRWNQDTIIENLHMRQWQLSAVWNYRNRRCEIRNNIIEKIGTYHFPDEEYLIAGRGRKTPRGPAVSRWPIYAGAAIYAHRSAAVSIHNNVLVDVHNLDRDDFPCVDKIHAIYAIAAQGVDAHKNCIQRVSGPALVIRLNSSDIRVTDNRFEHAAPVTDVTQYWKEPYVQQGFVRIPATFGQVPFDVTIEGNEFLYPFFWDIELGRRTECRGQKARKVSGAFFDGPKERFVMRDNVFALEWDPAWGRSGSTRRGEDAEQPRAGDVLKAASEE